jgi:hypothetical protein
MNAQFESGFRKWERLQPLYLYSTEEILYGTRETKGVKSISGLRRRVIWQTGNKTKVGIFQDGMWCRYGVSTYGVLTGNQSNGFWQSTPNTLTENEMNSLLAVANGDTNYPLFDIRTLKDLEH